MKTSVYISSEKIEALGYSKSGRGVSVKEYAAVPLPEGTMLSGRIIDNAALVECLGELKRSHPSLLRNVSLTVDGSAVLLKRLAVPRLNKWRYYQLIEDEFSEGTEELVCGYQLLGDKDKGRTMLVCAAEKALIENYMSAFKAVGVNLREIRIGVQSILDYVSESPELKNESFILNVIDGFTMLSMIFEKGANVFMSRARLYGDGSEERLRNILDNLSGLIQFNKSEKFSDITHSCYLGLSGEDIGYMSEISPHSDIVLLATDILKGARGADKLEKDVHFVYLNALSGKGGVDFLRCYKMRGKLDKRRKPKNVWLLLIVLLIAAVSVPAGYIYYRLTEVNREINEINGYLSGEYVSQKSGELDLIINETDYYNDIADQLRGKTSDDKKKTNITSEVTDLIFETAGDRISVDRLEYDESAGTLQFGARGGTETDSAEFTSELKRSALVKDIKYTGYSYTNNGEYSFSLSITLAAEE